MVGPTVRTGRDLRETLSILITGGLAALAAGLIISAGAPALAAAPGLLVMIPASISSRGNIFATFGNRLGSYLHLGVLPVRASSGREGIRVRWGFRRLVVTTTMRENGYALVALTLATSVAIGLLGAAASLFIGVPADWRVLVLASAAAGLASGLILWLITIHTAVGAYANGWDPDNVTAPAITLASDIVTLVALVVVVAPIVALPSRTLTTLAVGVVVLAVVLAVIPLLWRASAELTTRIVRESLPFFMMAATVSVIAGLFLGGVEEDLLANPGVLTLLPAFLGIGGSMGSILAARVGTGLHLGAVTPTVRPGPFVWQLVRLMHIVGLIVFPVLGIGTFLVNALFGIEGPGLGALAILATGAGLVLVAAVDAVAYGTSVAAYRRGLDPDNVVVPVVTSVIDVVGAALLVGVAVGLGIL